MSQSRNPAPRLLVLDDDIEVGELIGELAEHSGFRATVTHNAPAFNEELGKEPADMIVLDLQMPGTDGVEILRDLAASGTRAGVLVVSGMDKRTIASAEQFGSQSGLNVIGTLQKPFTPEAMIAKLESAHKSTRRLTGDDLARAIVDGQLMLHYQPVIQRIRAGEWRAESVEALLRWNHPSLGLLVPSQFLSLIDSDRGELMKQLTDFVFERGIEQLRAWQNDGIHIGLRVNVAAGLIADSRFPDRLEALLGEHDTDPELLTLEIREPSVLSNSNKGFDILTRLRLKSINLALDDVGGPHSSLHNLYSLPFGEIKFDRSLIAAIDGHSSAGTLVGGLIETAHRMEMSCCAVGVETEVQLDVLDEARCDRAQGFLIGSPVAAARVEEVLSAWTSAQHDLPLAQMQKSAVESGG